MSAFNQQWVYHDQAVNRLRDACRNGAKAWALANGFSPQFVCDVLQGRRDVSEKMGVALGLQRMTVFHEIGGGR